MLACLPKNIGLSSIFSIALVTTGCFDPDPTPLETEGSTGMTGDGSTAGMVCEPGDSQDCTAECASGSGLRLCNADGSGFGGCMCEGPDPSMSETGDTTMGPPPPECEADADCADMAEGECEEGVCSDDGTCVVQPLAEGTPCGDATEVECSGADVCDGAGTCSTNDAPDGSSCTGCPLGVCSCLDGSCGDCASFASSNDFITTRSIEGWVLTGGWRLYRETPQSQTVGPTVFGGQVLGTDGNRVEPYPGNEAEMSSARTPPMVLPASLEFLSWNVDEGSNPFDTKQVRVSTDGGITFVTLFDCAAEPLLQPFCELREAREPDEWDPISIPMIPELVGQVGIVELTYNTGDSCCGFEKGWFVDVTNFGTECACVDDDSCGGLGGECGAAVCGASGECALDAVAAGTACGDATDVECNAADACDGVGYCAPNLAPTGLTSCDDCPGGAGSCHVCQAGVCPDCVSLPAVNDFNLGAMSHTGWLVEDLNGNGADWRIYFSAPQNQDAGSMPVPLSFGPSFGTDGNRQVPYPGAHDEHSRVTTTPDVLPATLTFQSWNVDEGTNVDNKLIEVSVDGGATWNVLFNCVGGPGTQPFCQFRDATRLGNDWDSISIPTGAFAGQVGQIRITYDTLDSCCNFERGWFIDNLNFARYCSDPQFP